MDADDLAAVQAMEDEEDRLAVLRGDKTAKVNPMYIGKKQTYAVYVFGPDLAAKVVAAPVAPVAKKQKV